jgi:hypothetical protein
MHHARRDAVVTETTPDLMTVLDEIEQQLDFLARVCFGVDVREKYSSVTPVIDTVVKHSDAMHALLFVKRTVKEAQRDAMASPSSLPETRS